MKPFVAGGKQVLQWLVRTIAAAVPKLSKYEWAFFGAPFIVLIVFIISIGPEFQHAIVSVLNTELPKFDEHVKDQEIVRYPALADWLLEPINIVYILIGSLVSLWSLRYKTVSSICVSLACGVFVAYSFTDAIVHIAYGGGNFANYLLNLTFNMVGGVGAALVVSIVFLFYKFTVSSSLFGVSTKAIAGLILPASGVLASTIAFYILVVFFQTPPVRVTLQLEPDTTGFYGPASRQSSPSEEPQAGVSDKEQIPFSLFPSERVPGTLLVHNYDGQTAALWTRRRAARPYNIEIRYYADCPFRTVDQLNIGPATETIRDVDILRFGFDQGFSEVRTSKLQSANFVHNFRDLTAYWLNASGEPKSLEVKQLVSSDDRLTISSNEPVSVLIGGILSATDGGSMKRTPRTFEMSVNGEPRRSLMFEGSKLVPVSAPLRCRQIPVTPRMGPRDVPISHVSVLVTFKPVDRSRDVFYVEEYDLSVSGGSGYAEISGVPFADYDRGDGGQIDMITAVGGVSIISLDGKSVDMDVGGGIALLGAFRASVESGGRVRINGDAHAAWTEQRRLNTTIWTDLPNEWKIALLTALGGAILAFLKFVWPRLRQISGESPTAW